MLDDDFLKWASKMAKQPRFKTGAKDCFPMLNLKKNRLISLIHVYTPVIHQLFADDSCPEYLPSSVARKVWVFSTTAGPTFWAIFQSCSPKKVNVNKSHFYGNNEQVQYGDIATL